MLNLLMWGAGAIAVFAFLAWGNAELKAHYTEPLIAEHKAEMQACQSTIASQRTTITNQGASLADLQRRTIEQNGTIQRLADISKARGDEADALKAKQAQRRAPIQPQIDADAKAAAGPATGGTCEAQMKEIQQIGDEYARKVLGVDK